MNALKLLVGVLATWRIAGLLTYGHYGEWLRSLAKVEFTDEWGDPKTAIGRALSCFWCSSLWVGLCLAGVLCTGYWWITIPFALSGGAVILNHWTRIVRDASGPSRR